MPDRKPLELTVYPRRGRETYVVSVSPWVCLGEVAVDRRSEAKRLTGPELAAETWHSITKYYARCPSPEAVEEARRNRVIERFATHDHYDQEDQ